MNKIGFVLSIKENPCIHYKEETYARDHEMAIKERFFLVGEEWNVIHLPSKPNGFAVFIIGDVNNYVQSNTSSWHQRPDQVEFIKELKKAGYTVVSSNLFGRNWGSEEACYYLQRLYEEVMKKEILNRKVHIIAEGMGALVAAKLVPNLLGVFRSVVMINPCLNLKDYFHREKNNKLFYKRFLKELKKAYQLDIDMLELTISSMDISHYKAMTVPTKIFHCMNATPFSLQDHVRPYEQLCNTTNTTIVDVSIFLKSKPFSELARPTIQFLKNHEKNL
ncbi:alpha/beta hydrolase [Anaerobacillus alkaliphilus]|uniref:Alpha/beta hydrolase n=1 Tax=Anaerobacillus alkaliphilus TaxID=1548597 RepID=A0A4Q0VQM0_9BACI|nr:alpha/beta hydrolase [Anaerobacillus alkaliphilus]RXI98265.1 alpha/beta hydrolase [Anaerobacillus alkaliphilus]